VGTIRPGRFDSAIYSTRTERERERGSERAEHGQRGCFLVFLLSSVKVQRAPRFGSGEVGGFRLSTFYRAGRMLLLHVDQGHSLLVTENIAVASTLS